MFDCVTANLMHLRLHDDQIPWPFLDHLDPFSTDFDSLQWSFQEPKLQVPTISYHIQPARPETARGGVDICEQPLWCKVHQTWGFGTLKSFFWLFFVAIPWCSIFLIISCCGNEVFSVLQVQKTEAATSACESFSHACQSKLGRFSQETLAVTVQLFAVVFNMSLHRLM